MRATPGAAARMVVAVAILAGLAAGTARAQEGSPELAASVPETPALAFLDATVANVLEPGSARDFALALLSGTDESGFARRGFAVEVTPWFLVPGVAIDGRRYRESRLAFVLANAQLSVGTARGDGEEADTDLAVGLRFPLVDRGDPLRSESFRRALADALLACAPAQPDPTPSEACVSRETEEAWEAWTAERWNAARLGVAAAWGMRLASSELDERAYAGWQGWLVAAAPLGRRGHVVAQIAREERPELGEELGVDAWTIGARALAGGPRIQGFVEILGEWRELAAEAADEVADDVEDDRGVWSAGVEARIAEGLWASAGFGSRFAALAEESEKTFVLVGLRWGISSAARLDALRPPRR